MFHLCPSVFTKEASPDLEASRDRRFLDLMMLFWLSIRSPPAVWLAKSRHSGETFASPLLSFVEDAKGTSYDCGLDSQVIFNVRCHFTIVGMGRSDLDEGNSVQFVIIRQIHANRPLSSVHCRHVSGTVHAYLTYCGTSVELGVAVYGKSDIHHWIRYPVCMCKS